MVQVEDEKDTLEVFREPENPERQEMPSSNRASRDKLPSPPSRKQQYLHCRKSSHILLHLNIALVVETPTLGQCFGYSHGTKNRSGQISIIFPYFAFNPSSTFLFSSPLNLSTIPFNPSSILAGTSTPAKPSIVSP